MSGKRAIWQGFGLRSGLAIGAGAALAGMLAVAAVSPVPAAAQEKRTVHTESDFHWQGSLKAGQTLEVINSNGDVEATGTTETTAKAEGTRYGSDSDTETFVEVVEYPDGVTICEVYAKDKTPGRCHRGGVSEDWSHNWHGHRAKINFTVQVPAGVKFNAHTTNGGINARDLSSVVEAATTNGNVEVSTSEWASAHTTNGGVRVSMGKAQWSGELSLHTTNGSVNVTLPASAEFEFHGATTNGGIHTDFPITVEGNLSSKNLSGKIGAGGRELSVHTTNGGIELHKS